MNGTFIKLYRNITEWEWYQDLPVLKLYIHLCIVANYKNTRWQGKEIKRGQRVTSRDSLSKETGLTIQQVRTALKKLESTREITIQTTNRYTLITIVKYDRYQGKQDFDNQMGNRKDNHKLTTNKESNKDIYNTIDDEDKDDLHGEIKAAYQTFFGKEPNPEEINYLVRILKQYNKPQLLYVAIKRAATYGAKAIGPYVEKIIKDWDYQGIETLDELSDYDYNCDCRDKKINGMGQIEAQRKINDFRESKIKQLREQ